MDCRDVTSNIQTLGANQTISDAVNSLLASYEDRAYHDLTQGKPQLAKRSGICNTHDTIATHSLSRWPNGGFPVLNGIKRLTYDELSLPQWVTSQLTNIDAISDPVLVKQAIP